MGPGDTVVIGNADNNFRGISALKDSFTDFAKTAASKGRVPAVIEFQDDCIYVKALSFVAVANPRFVKNVSDDFLVEYIFNVTNGDESIEVWRFYLGESAFEQKIFSDSGKTKPICDANNAYINDKICTNVIIGALNSDLFKPSDV